ncbi:EscE/YscE/SsaE family type III secretion system needle protein co-chaperone [Providencia rettgeri]|uniref:EscE/YscE/SsaE family type III secretion system needle protein co-chaperone n=1 Tax=Providencia rettgeri TaxID=587 RepID=UPI0034E0AF46
MSQLTDLEIELREDKSGDYRDSLLLKINLSQEKILKDLYLVKNSVLRERIYHILDAHQQAEKIIKIIWKRYHSETIDVY